MKTVVYDQMGAIEDDFWTERLQLFTAQFPTYYTTPQKVWGKFHACDERYFDGSHEIIPLAQRKGQRTYVMMHPYVHLSGISLFAAGRNSTLETQNPPIPIMSIHIAPGDKNFS